MEILKSTNRAPDFCLVSRRANGSILEYVPIGATRKPGKKTSCMVYFIVSMALTHKKWIHTLVDLEGKLFKGIEMRGFPKEEKDQAIEFLKNG